MNSLECLLKTIFTSLLTSSYNYSCKLPSKIEFYFFLNLKKGSSYEKILVLNVERDSKDFSKNGESTILL